MNIQIPLQALLCSGKGSRRWNNKNITSIFRDTFRYDISPVKSHILCFSTESKAKISHLFQVTAEDIVTLFLV